MWKNVNKENVKELPHGIDGVSHFLIKNIVDVKARRKALSSDGRRWSKDLSTRWAKNTVICASQTVVDLMFAEMKHVRIKFNTVL